MKSFELKPTEENLLSTYKNDQIGRNTDIHAFVDILNSLEDSCSIALDGAWGSGKTFFVKQVKMVLESCSPIKSKSEYRDEIKTVWKNYHSGKEPEFQAQLCVYYDAWENDNDGDPILSLVYSILQQVDEETPFPKDNKIFEKVAALADCITGKSTTAVLESMKSDSALDDLRKSKSIHSTIVEFLDHFFSGSATTAHAVMKLNAEDGGHRKFIMVQLPEKTDEKSEAYKAGYKNICEIGKERIRRAGRKIKEDAGLTAPADLDIGFRCLRLDESNMKPVYYTPDEVGQQDLFSLVDNVKEDRTPEDLLFQVMLDLGVLLSSPIEVKEIAGKKVFNVADGFLLACFDHDVTEETVKTIAQMKPYYAVFRDSSMANDSVATNFDQIFETYSPDTVRKVL